MKKAIKNLFITIRSRFQKPAIISGVYELDGKVLTMDEIAVLLNEPLPDANDVLNFYNRRIPANDNF